MKNSIRSFAVVLMVAGLVVPALVGAAPKAVLSEISGKVEIKLWGESAWKPAAVGMELNLRDTISTGFDSSATITIDKNKLFVKALSRLSIDKLTEQGNKVSTTTFLKVGTVEASIKSAEGTKQDFKVQSPYSTASVRGTEFVYDGLRLKVTAGMVAFIPGPPEREPEPAPKARQDGGKKAESEDEGGEDEADAEDGDQEGTADGGEGEDTAGGDEGDGESGDGGDATIEDLEDLEGYLVEAGYEAVMELGFDGDFTMPEISDGGDGEGTDPFDDVPDYVSPETRTGNVTITITLPQEN